MDMYSQHDVLSEFKRSMIGMLPEDKAKLLPEDLQKGDLELSKVLESQFFFA